ncbi:Kelch-like protein 38 [Branchiostoma belcheri]|nr:Kelch-like protein 38 [Branchiostoma belcheri]
MSGERRCTFCARDCQKGGKVCEFCSKASFRFRRLPGELNDHGTTTTYMVKDWTRDQQLLTGLNQLREAAEFTDITLICAEGKTLVCHKVVLATNPYFQTMFSTDMRESKENKVTFENIEVDVMAELVSFLYTGEMTLTLQNASSLLEAACMLQFERVQEICCEYLGHHICVTNCLEIWGVADMLGCGELARKAEAVAVRSFRELSAGNALLSLSDVHMGRYMSSRLLHATPVEVLNMVVRWYTHDRDRGRHVLPDLLSQLDLTTPETLQPHDLGQQQDWQENIDKHMEQLVNLHGLSEAEASVVKESLSRPSSHPTTEPSPCTANTNEFEPAPCTTEENEPWTLLFGMSLYNSSSCSAEENKPSPCMAEECAVLVAGEKQMNPNSRWATEFGSDRRNFVTDIGLFCPKLGVDFLGSPAVDLPDTGLSGCSVAVWEDKLFVTGGVGDMGVRGILWCFNLTSQTWEFQDTMCEQRSYHGSAVISNILYIFGGRSFSSGTATDGMEAWDLVTMEPLSTPRALESFCLAASCVCQGKIYVFGGEEYWREEPLPWIQCYDPQSNTWTKTESLMVANKGSAAAALGDRILVVGGELWSGVLEYSPHSGQISTLPGLRYPRAFHGVAVLSGRVYVFGGKDVANNDETKLYELPSEWYDTESETWVWLDSLHDDNLIQKCYWEKVFGFGCAVFPAIQYSFD